MFAASRTSSLVVGRRVLHSSGKSQRTPLNDNMVKARSSTKTKSATELTKRNASTAVTESFAKRSPFLFQLGVATGKTMAADFMTQTVAEGKSLKEIDWKRNGIFVVFGFAYLGGFQYWLMVTKYRQWFPTMDRFGKLGFADKLKDTAGMLDALKMVVFDVVVHLPMIYFPVYYTVKEVVTGSSWNPLHWMKDGVSHYSTNMREDLTAMIQLWGPSDCIQFVLPIHIRMPFRHLVSFFWTAYVSFTRGSYKEEITEEETATTDLPPTSVATMVEA